MKKNNKWNISKIKNNKITHYLLIIIIGILISIPFLWVQIKTTDDGKFHLLRLIGLNNAIKSSSFPFLVFPFFCNDWGYSMTTFYPPIVTYIPYILGIISRSFANGLKLFAMITTIFSGIFMYNFVKDLDDKFIRNKTIQKACESFRVQDDKKAELRKLRIN